MVRSVWIQRLRETAPRVHCLTNPVTMQDVANVLLAAGGSAIMGQERREVQELTALCQATLLNLGVPDGTKLESCRLAGQRANELGHPVILDPVGVGASRFRRDALRKLGEQVRPSLIRCNQEEACVLLDQGSGASGGVESGVELEGEAQLLQADQLARRYGCAVLISGKSDAVSDGTRRELLTGGDQRMRRITGSGCMLSALCALFAGAGLTPYEAACAAGSLWKKSARIAGQKTDRMQEGTGSFHRYLFDAVDRLCCGDPEQAAEDQKEEDT